MSAETVGAEAALTEPEGKQPDVWSRIVVDDGGTVCCGDCGCAAALDQHRRGDPKQTKQDGHIIICRQFNRADGTTVAGPMMSQGARFKGWQFRLSDCNRCCAHLGWCYQREGLPPFWELIVDILREKPEAVEPDVALPSPVQSGASISVYSPFYKDASGSPLQSLRSNVAPRPLLTAMSPIHQAIQGVSYRPSWVVRSTAPMADAWARPEPKYRSKWMSHENLRRYDEDWRQAECVSYAQLRALQSYFPGPYIDSAEHTAQSCKALFLQRHLEFGYTLDFNPAFFCELAHEGFFPMGLEHPQDRRIQVLGLCFDHRVHVLDFMDVHLSRQMRRRAGRYTLTVDSAFDDVLLGCVRMHGEAWLYRGCRWVLRTLFQQRSSGAVGLGVHSIELWDAEGQLAAGDLGYTLGSVYTSMTGFREQHTKGAGEVQLVLAAALLHKLGFAWVDLGQVLGYKSRLGAKVIDRASYLERLCRDRDRPVHLSTSGRAEAGSALLEHLVALQNGNVADR